MKFSRLLIAAVLLAGLSVAYYYAGKHEPTDTTKKAAVEPIPITELKQLAAAFDDILMRS